MKIKNIALICMAALALNCSKGKLGGVIDGEAIYNGGKVSTISAPVSKDTTTKQEHTLYALGTTSGIKMLNSNNIYISRSFGWAWQKTGASYEESKKYDLGMGNHLSLLSGDTLYHITPDSLYCVSTDRNDTTGFHRIKK